MCDLFTETLDTVLVPPTINADLETLRAFDHNNDYGPKIGMLPCQGYIKISMSYMVCVGMTRLECWERAEKLGLNPDPKIKEIIEQHKDDTDYTQWYVNDT